MRKKPVTRDEVRIEGAGSAYAHITTLPRNTVRERGNKLEAIPKVWAPLLQELNRVAKEWSESPRGLEHRKWCLEQGYSDPLQPITMPEPSRYARCPACRHCGRRFYRAREGNRPEWRLRTGHYCSDRCQRLANAPARKARRAAWVKMQERADARADLECDYCGKPIEAQRSTMRFCSTRCRVAAYRERARSASPRKSR